MIHTLTLAAALVATFAVAAHAKSTPPADNAVPKDFRLEQRPFGFSSQKPSTYWGTPSGGGASLSEANRAPSSGVGRGLNRL